MGVVPSAKARLNGRRGVVARYRPAASPSLSLHTMEVSPWHSAPGLFHHLDVFFSLSRKPALLLSRNAANCQLLTKGFRGLS